MTKSTTPKARIELQPAHKEFLRSFSDEYAAAPTTTARAAVLADITKKLLAQFKITRKDHKATAKDVSAPRLGRPPCMY